MLVFWQKEVNEDEFKQLLEKAKIPENCDFLQVLEVNREVWTETRNKDLRNKDFALQKISQTLGATTSCMLQTANKLSEVCEEFSRVSSDLASKLDPVRECITSSLMLSGALRRQVNNHRRECFKPSIPVHLKNIVTTPDTEYQQYLFGDSIKDNLQEIRGDNSIRDEFKGGQN